MGKTKGAIIEIMTFLRRGEAESASWAEGDAASRDMRMSCFGGNFDDPDFVALSFFTDQLDEIMK